MIYIYHDFGGTHTTAMAAAYHLKFLSPSSQSLTQKEILAIPFFNKLKKKDAGRLIFHGKDEEGNPVYTIGRRNSKLVIPALKDLCSIFEERYDFDEKIIFSDTSPTVPLAMTFGGLFSRGLGIDFIGVPLLIKGAQKCGNHVYQLVESTKQIAHDNKDQKIITIENKRFQA
ncbi:DUF3189 family protein [Neobacillus massiliamazoniensis]|uniref:DUF3189 family protein n=1 Tax=Neobacillus massiliamazoniensis TaxID=1499688 RepID=A0A0U1NXJ1_9BACI|nr:DUF3189 family protein [Neobacillus massiliamazoniensis]CRK82731.1 hypothetical protein BN000_02676 [Neobacillus massiliamazoniensis]